MKLETEPRRETYKHSNTKIEKKLKRVMKEFLKY